MSRRRGFADIFLYTIENFGARQANRYSESLERCFEMLADHPRMGRTATALGPGIRRHEHESHVILYRVDGDGALIVAIVHQRNVRGLEL